MAGPLLTIDVGNSRAKFGLFDGGAGGAAPLPACDRMLAVAHGEPVPWHELESWLPASSRDASRVVAATVYPAGLERLISQWPAQGWLPPDVIDRAALLPLAVRLEHPDRVGIDRLLNAVAVNALRPAGRPAVIVSAGTATTVDRIAPDGTFEGGAILPGMELGAKSLHQHTALLPQIEVQDLSGDQVPALGTNTPSAIRSGLLYGQVGAIRELVSRLSPPESEPALVIFTGGAGHVLAPLLGNGARFEPDLVLRGLALIAENLNLPLRSKSSSHSV